MANIFKSIAIILAGFTFFGQVLNTKPVAADGLPTANSPGSKYTISYTDWDYVLEKSVLKTGRSDRRPASRATLKNTATRIKHGNRKATGLEGNRVLFHEFDDRHRALLLSIRKDLEAVSDSVTLQSFSKSEQLAYWLNLHNVAVMLEVSKRYPIKNLKRISTGKNDIWTNEIMSINGVSTSIRDIENHVIANWNNPLVLYGFYMGVVGGPNIRTEAFTADTLTKQLTENAADFVNSLRGVRFWGGEARISSHYKMGARYFPDFKKDVRNHMIQYADARLDQKLAAASTFNAASYDWGIADLKNGDSYSGSSHNTNPGALTHFIEGPNPNGGPAVSIHDSFASDPAVVNHLPSGLAPHVAAFFEKLKERNDLRERKEKITIEEFTTNKESRVSTKK